MPFNTEIFLFFFLPLCLVLFYLIKGSKYRIEIFVLSFFSLLFYAWDEPKWLILLIISIVSNYFFGQIIYKENRRYILTISIIFNISFIAWFKYRYFIANTFLGTNLENNFFIPLAISFFTFQQIAFLVDIHDKSIKPLKFLDHLFFVSFFPQLIAGPIVLAKDIVPQINKMKEKKKINSLILGIFIFFVGLFKKAFLSDNLVPYICIGFNNIYNDLTFIEAWATISMYALRLYFDFSGYSDMAVGLGLLFGLRLPVNFNLPYKSRSIIDFWKRWHITLTKFFTFYLYSPLSLYMSRVFSNNLIFLLIIPFLVTFILSGLWHGADWKFVFFGLVNGIGLIINHLWKFYKMPKLPYIIGWFLTMTTILVSFVFFRANTTEEAIYFLSIMFNPSIFFSPHWLEQYIDIKFFKSAFTPLFSSGVFTLKYLVVFLFSFTLAIKIPNVTSINFRLKYNWYYAFLLAIMVLFSIINLNKEDDFFIYFQF
ncbi:MBOAT family protein [Alphaproteobacteria bacterium]|nr:MBOAT family protein [Alphaproteobacteria bacterium]